MSSSRIIPILLLGALALAALGSRLMGKKNQSFNGVIAQDFNTYEFYPGAKDCKYRGMPYVLLPNERFHDIVTLSTDPEHMDRLFHGVWRAKLNGNLSRIGWFRYRKPYLRELSVNYVVDAVPLDCRDAR